MYVRTCGMEGGEVGPLSLSPSLHDWSQLWANACVALRVPSGTACICTYMWHGGGRGKSSLITTFPPWLESTVSQCMCSSKSSIRDSMYVHGGGWGESSLITTFPPWLESTVSQCMCSSKSSIGTACMYLGERWVLSHYNLSSMTGVTGANACIRSSKSFIRDCMYVCSTYMWHEEGKEGSSLITTFPPWLESTGTNACVALRVPSGTACTYILGCGGMEGGGGNDLSPPSLNPKINQSCIDLSSSPHFRWKKMT